MPRPPIVKGLPLLGNLLSFAGDPLRFFVKCYRDYGPAFQVKVLGNTYVCLAGAEAASFLGTREGKDVLRSREIWAPLMNEFGASKMLSAEDGQLHKDLRGVMKRGFSKDAIKGRFEEMFRVTADCLQRDWKLDSLVPVVGAMQYMIVEQLGITLTGSVPRGYIKDIRTTILYILNVLVTKQRPMFMIRMPEYKRAKARMLELGRKMVEDYLAHETAYGAKPEDEKTLVDDIMEAHRRNPELIPERDLPMLMAGPYVAGLDTVANTTSAILYGVLKHPEVLARIHKELDELFTRDVISEDDFIKDTPALGGAIMESMRLYPIAVAQIRTANKDFVFAGKQILEGETIYLGTSVPHLQGEFYPEPERFDIDRYGRDRAEHMQAGAYSPFGRGPHTCLGKTLAEVLMAITMAQIFHKLDLQLHPSDYALRTKAAPTPGPAMSFKVKVKGFRHPLSSNPRFVSLPSVCPRGGQKATSAAAAPAEVHR